MIKIDLFPTKKFKTTLITVRMIAPFEKTTINDRALIPGILVASTKRYKSKAGISRRLDGLYGTILNVFTSKIGIQSVIHFSVQFPSDRFLPEHESLSLEAVELLKEIIFNPLTKSGYFPKSVVSDEIRLLKENIESEYNDKNEYAFQQFKKAMFKDELYALRTRGDYDTLDQSTPKSLWEGYQEMIKNDEIHISVVGDFDSVAITKELNLNFDIGRHDMPHQWIDTEGRIASEPRVIEEFNHIKQAKIMIGFRTSIRFGTDDYMAMVVFNTLFGDSDQARLFRVIREEHHLCYYVSSSFDSNKGVLFITLGVEPGQESKATDLALKVLDDMKAGLWSDEDLEFAKSFQNKRIRQRDDSIVSLSSTDFYFRQVYGEPYDTAEQLRNLSSVERTDIIRSSQSLRLDTVYTLTKKASL